MLHFNAAFENAHANAWQANLGFKGDLLMCSLAWLVSNHLRLLSGWQLMPVLQCPGQWFMTAVRFLLTTSCYASFRLHEDVALALTDAGISHQLEATSSDGFFSFDILAQVNGRNVVIEVDGPAHFTALQPFRPLGGTCMRNKLFDAAGHTGIAIAFFQWNRLQSRESRAAYMHRRLSQV